MRALIETYRGWEIYFDTDKEEFYTVSNQYDNDKVKKYYTSAKKYIDDYIKENSDFKPIKVQKMPSMFGDGETITLIGIRKDKAFMYEDKDGNKKQLSSYSENDYFLIKEENKKHFEKVAELRIERNKIDEELKKIEENVIKVTVKQIRRQLLGE